MPTLPVRAAASTRNAGWSRWPGRTACGCWARTVLAWSTPIRRSGSTRRWPRSSRRPAGSASSASQGRWASPSWPMRHPEVWACPRSSRPAIGRTFPGTTCCSSGTVTSAPKWCWLYLESFGNPRKFARLAKTLARTKPVIAVKSGRHALVSPGLAASSAAISEEAVAALFGQSGVIRTQTLTRHSTRASCWPTNRSRPVTGSRSWATRRPSACSRSTPAWMRVWRGGRGTGRFRVNVSPEDLGSAVRIAVGRPDVDAVVVVFVPPVAVPGQAHAEALRAAAAGSSVPVVSTFLSVDGLSDALSGPGAGRWTGPGFGAVVQDAGAGRCSTGARCPVRLVAGQARWQRPGAGRCSAG